MGNMSIKIIYLQNFNILIKSKHSVNLVFNINLKPILFKYLETCKRK